MGYTVHMILDPATNPIIVIALSLLVLAISITIHEFMHAYVGLKLGDSTAKEAGRLSLNPLKHIDIFTTVLLPIVLIMLGLPPFGAARPVPLNPFQIRHAEFGLAMVGVAGPLTNLLLAIIGGFVLRFTGTIDNDIWLTWWWLFTTINTGFFIFNMIPFPPLDGSRVLFAFAPQWLQRIMLQIESMGFVGILIFMLLLFPFLSPILRMLNQNLIALLLGISI